MVGACFDGSKFLNLIKYRNKTVQDVFDECELSIEAETVLSANAGILCCHRMSFLFCLCGVIC